MNKEINKALLPLGMGLLVIGLTLGLNANKVFLAFIPVGLVFLIISFITIMKDKKKK